MTRTALALAAALLTAATAAAQTKEVVGEVKALLDSPRKAEEERTEDVEVLRRILNRSLGMPDKATAGTPYQTGTPFNPGTPSPTWNVPFGGVPGTTFNQPQFANTFHANVVSAPPVGPFDGVYLLGHGVVLTLRVPESAGVVADLPAKAVGLAEFCVKCHMAEPVSRTALEPTTPAGPPATEWDRVRDEIRGRKSAETPRRPATVARAEICEPGKLANQLVARLAPNARQVRHLPAAEYVTIVVTFDAVSGPARNRQVLNPGPGAVLVDGARPGKSRPSPGRGASGVIVDPTAPVHPADLPPGTTLAIYYGFNPDEVQLLILGELHMKQNKPKDAADAYTRALVRYKATTIRHEYPSGQAAKEFSLEKAAETEAKVRDAYRRLAQAWLAAGDADKAQIALDMARKFTIEFGTAPAFATGIPVPAKLVVSVAKADIDKAGDDLTAFKKAVKVETVGFPPADKK